MSNPATKYKGAWSTARRLDDLSPPIRNALLRKSSPEEQFLYLVFGYDELPEDIIISALRHAPLSTPLLKQLPEKIQRMHRMLWEL